MENRVVKDSLILTDLDGIEHRVAKTEIIWRPSAYGIVIKDQRILLCYIEKYGYGLPGGGVELGETMEQTVEREIHEETGVSVRCQNLIGARTSLFKGPGEDENFSSILLYYVAEYLGGEISSRFADEWEKQNQATAKWVDINQIDTLPICGTVDWRDVVKGVL
jgi:ADP-ribose pyrophosphatase YjhB (NUDIX family)